MIASILLIVNALWNFDSSQWNIKNYKIRDGLKSQRIYDFVKDHRGRYWLGSNAGLAYFDGYQFQYVGSENGLKYTDIIDLYYANKHLYSVTLNKIEAIDINSISNKLKSRVSDYSTLERLGPGCTKTTFNCYLRNRVLVFYGLNLEVFHLDIPYYNNGSREFRSLRMDCQNQTNSEQLDSIQCLLNDSYYLTENKILKLDDKNHLKIYHSFKDYLNYNTFFFIDSTNIYFNTLNNSKQYIYNIKESHFKSFTRIDEPLSFSLYQDIGFMLTTYKNGIYLYTLKQYKRQPLSGFNYDDFYKQENILYEHRPYEIDKHVKKQGQMYQFYYQKKWVKYPSGIKSYIKLNEKDFWIGTREGTYQYRIGDDLTKIPKLIDSSWILRLKKFDNRLFILTYDNFKILEGKRKRVFKLNYKKAYVLVNDIDFYKGKYLLGTNDQGFFLSDTGFRSFKNVSEKDGLQSKLIKRVKADRNGNIWVLNDKGVDRINRDLSVTKVFSIAEINDYDIENFTVSKDSLWLFTENTVYSLNYKQRFTEKKMPIVLNNLTVDNRDIYYEADSNIRIGPKWEIIKLNFAGIFIHDQEHIAYKYRLIQNKDTGTWQITKINELTLAALKAGNYSVQVVAYHDIYPNIHSNTLNVSWVILPYFYQTWWFYSLIFIGFMAIVLSAVWYRNRIKIRELKLASELNKYRLHGLQNQMNPHFVFNSMSTIQNMILNEDTKQALDFISDFSTLMRTMLQNSRNDEISIVNELDFLKKYAELERTRYKENFDINFHVEIDEFELEDIYIPNMMVQPLLENAIKHGVSNLKDRRGEIHLYFGIRNQDAEYLEIKITDNGYGKTHQTAKKHQSTAMKVIQERLEIYQKNGIFGSIDIQHTNIGTTCVLTLPV